MGISIIIPWNNTNLEYLNNILYKISKTVIPQHQVIIVTPQELPKFTNMTVVFSDSKNIVTQFIRGIELSDYEYIWFFDTEKPFQGLVNFGFPKDCDFYQYKNVQKTYISPDYPICIKKSDFPSNSFECLLTQEPKVVSNFINDKIYKKPIVLEALKKIENENIFENINVVLNKYIVSNVDTIGIMNETLYIVKE